jgi:hypothetical protein
MVRSVHAPVEGCVSLLSLIPCLIKQSVAFWWCLWVWLGGTLLLLGSGHVPVFVAGGLAHCWVLRRHPCCGCCSLVRSWPGRPNASCLSPVWVVWFVVAVWWLGCGCVLSVA